MKGSIRAIKRTFNAVIKQDDGWWIGWVEEIPQQSRTPSIARAVSAKIEMDLALGQLPGYEHL